MFKRIARPALGFTVIASMFTAGVASESRQDLGIFGGTVLTTLYNSECDRLFAAVGGPLSLFVSDDTGRSWAPAFPDDSLKWIDGQFTRGWGGRGVGLYSNGGITIAQTSEEGGTLWGFEISRDGDTWNTLWDEKISRSWATAYAAQVGYNIYANGGATAAVRNGKLFLGLKGALLISSDTGKTWTGRGFPDSTGLRSSDANAKRSVYHILPVKADLSRILVVAPVTANGLGAQVSGSGALYATTDTGKSFSRVIIIDSIKQAGGPSIPDTLENINVLAYAPVSTDTVFILNTVQQSGTPSLNTAVYMSPDAGVTWQKMYEQAPGNNANQLNGLMVFQDAGLPGINHIRLVSGAYWSDSLGSSWTLMPARNGEAGQVTSITGHIPETDVWFASSDMGPKVSTTGINASASAYALGTEGMTSLTIRRVAQLPQYLDRVYMATNAGLAFTTAYTDTNVAMADKWKAPYGQFPIVIDINCAVSDVAICPTDTAKLIAAAGNGFCRTSTGGHTRSAWTMVNYSSITGWTNGCWPRDIEYYSADTVFSAMSSDQSTEGALVVTYNHGTSWSKVAGIGNRPVNSVTVAQNAAGVKVIYVGTGKGSVKGKIFRSADGGATWDSIVAPTASNNPTKTELPVRDIENKPGSVDTIYIACGDNTDWAVGWSFNRGDSITAISGFAGGAEISKIAVNKNHPDSIYFAMRNQICLLNMNPDTTKPVDSLPPPDTGIIVPPPPGPGGPGQMNTKGRGFMMSWFQGYPGEILYDIHYDELVMASSIGASGITGPTPGGMTGIGERAGALRVSLAPRLVVSQKSRMVIVSGMLATAGQVKLELYSLNGKREQLLFSGFRKAGLFREQYDSRRIGSGVHLITATTPAGRTGAKVVVRR